MKDTVLIVDDESYIREFVAQVLSEYYKVLFAKNGDEACEMAIRLQPSLIILDILMPGQNGIEICKILRGSPETKKIPVIMLTALNEPESLVGAFASGADDFLTKPFVPAELVARVASKIRRSKESLGAGSGRVLNVGNLKVDFDGLRVEVSGEPLDLGTIEFKILKFLVQNQDQVVLREELHSFVWGSETPSDRALDPHITSLRKKLKDSSGALKTIYGRGYSFILKSNDSCLTA
jgi:DNA-binding response OmpR family regulator